MIRKEDHHSISRLLFRRNHKGNTITHPSKENELTVQINLQGRKPMIMKVPGRCNMKILKSMIHFHLKKTLSANQYNLIVGLQTQQGNYELDYLLQNGLGVLQNNLFLNCLQKNQIKVKRNILNYKICRLISVGGFSKVYLMRDRSNGQFLAGKFIVKQKLNQEMVQNQFDLSSKIVHPFIQQTYDLIQTDHFYIFLLEFYSGGELFQLMKKNRHMKEENARFYVVQALLALKQIHQKSIIFRDIKPENILIDQYGHIRLVDFGLAKRITHRAFSFCGSLDYMAPEIIRDEGHSFEADYYSIGNLLFEILVGSPPFYHPKFSPQETKFHILNTQLRFPEYLNLSSSVIDLMKRLLTKEPSERLGFQGGINAILSHEWFSDVSIQEYMNKQIDPPISIEVKLSFFQQQNSQEKNMWQALLEKDVKQQALKQAIRNSKTAKGNRHRSLNSQKSCEDRESQGQTKTIQGKVNAKLKTNMCLLYVLTHKRVSSECPNTPTKPLLKKNVNYLSLKSTNLSRKSSVFYKSHNKMKSSLDTPTMNAKSDIKYSMNEQTKESTIKKRKKENQPFLKHKRQ